MEDLGTAAVWGLVVAASLLAGGMAAAVLELPDRIAALVSAFGGGILFAAVALELVPDADAEAGTALTAAGLLVGALVYVGADTWLTRDEQMKEIRRSAHAAASGRAITVEKGQATTMEKGRGETARGESIAAGIFVDGVPESLALGITVAEGEIGVALLAGILVGNVVESYGAAQPIVAGGRSSRFAVGLLGVIGLALAAATVLGATVLADASPELIGSAQAVAAGAVLAVVSIAIIPYAFEQVSSTVATAIVAGFIGGYLLS